MRRKYNGNTFHFCGKDWKIKNALSKDIDAVLIKLYDKTSSALADRDLNVTEISIQVNEGYAELCALLLDGFTPKDLENLTADDKVLLPYLLEIAQMYLYNLAPEVIEDYLERMLVAGVEIAVSPRTSKQVANLVQKKKEKQKEEL